jgi:pheromone shutdown protein TraB
VKQLVRAVKPDVVGVELCRSRLALLADDSKDVISNLVWHCRKVRHEMGMTNSAWSKPGPV